MVMIERCQRLDPSSILGGRTFLPFDDFPLGGGQDLGTSLPLCPLSALCPPSLLRRTVSLLSLSLLLFFSLCLSLCTTVLRKHWKIETALGGVRTHALRRELELESSALDHSATGAGSKVKVHNSVSKPGLLAVMSRVTCGLRAGKRGVFVVRPLST
jgi:hypothetical protein